MTLEVVVRPRHVYCQQKHLLHDDFWWLFQDGRRAEITAWVVFACMHQFHFLYVGIRGSDAKTSAPTHLSVM